MTPTKETVPGTLVFLECGCSAWHWMTHPTGKALLVEIIQSCAAHARESAHIRAVRTDETVRPWTRTPVSI